MPRGIKKGLNTKKFDSCISKVKRKGGQKILMPYVMQVWLAKLGEKERQKNKLTLIIVVTYTPVN